MKQHGVIVGNLGTDGQFTPTTLEDLVTDEDLAKQKLGRLVATGVPDTLHKWINEELARQSDPEGVIKLLEVLSLFSVQLIASLAASRMQVREAAIENSVETICAIARAEVPRCMRSIWAIDGKTPK